MDISTMVVILSLFVLALDVGLIVISLIDLANTPMDTGIKVVWLFIILAVPILGPILSMIYDHESPHFA